MITRLVRGKLAGSSRALVLALSLGACGGPSAPSAATPVAAPPSVEERIARGVAEASPPADPADAKARDAAAERLGHLAALLDAAGDRILWGGFDPEKGYHPKAQQLTEFSPVVWVKLYLSTFMFTGAHQVRREGELTVLELGARFRDGLDSGDYPYPFWHSAQKWQAYANTEALMLIFEHDRLIAAYRKPSPVASNKTAAKKWDGRWRWTDEAGVEQPRVALFSYLLSPDNPSRERLDGAYRSLEEAFRNNNCLKCHSPDNAAHASALLLLDYPNQALVARHSLVTTLRLDAMPPADPGAGTTAGLHDAPARGELLALAEKFEREADAALAFERARASAKGGEKR